MDLALLGSDDHIGRGLAKTDPALADEMLQQVRAVVKGLCTSPASSA